MNLFVTSLSPTLAAQSLCDIRLRKMILETAQLLCTELRRRGADYMPYKSTHPMHPVTLSLRNDATLLWVEEYFGELHKEYKFRFNKNHKSYVDCWLKIKYAMLHYVNLKASNAIFTNCARNDSLGLDYSHWEITEAYQAYLTARWTRDTRPPCWTNRGAPKFANAFAENSA